jgi:hypothetical protein
MTRRPITAQHPITTGKLKVKPYVLGQAGAFIIDIATVIRRQQIPPSTAHERKALNLNRHSSLKAMLLAASAY